MLQVLQREPFYPYNAVNFPLNLPWSKLVSNMISYKPGICFLPLLSKTLYNNSSIQLRFFAHRCDNWQFVWKSWFMVSAVNDEYVANQSFLLSEFSSSTLIKVIQLSYPTFTLPWFFIWYVLLFKKRLWLHMAALHTQKLNPFRLSNLTW